MIVSVISEIDSLDDRAFMTRLYEDYWRLMFSTAGKCCGQRADREDMVQESLLRLIAHVKTLRTMERAVLASYIVITVRNTCFTQLAREKKEMPNCVSWEDALGGDDDADQAPNLMEQLEQAALVERLWQVIMPEERFLLECRYSLGYSDKELAKYLNCKPGSVRMKLTRARRKAQSILLSWEEAEKFHGKIAGNPGLTLTIAVFVIK